MEAPKQTLYFNSNQKLSYIVGNCLTKLKPMKRGIQSTTEQNLPII